ncbi:YHS domain-containing (seleno)protein [Flagellimonas marinaquae]|uniref:YHS domain-containing (seleno)protein n=1 Tax=Flagellimonas marinaquae TaxID=254955 RepID=UPI000F8DC874|nr:YHS domain-containing (seleno)protein [Allomuricauda aquimarina]
MRIFLILFILSTSTSGWTQSIDYNTKNGYAIHGYDVVSYFEGEPVEGKKEFTTTYDGTKFQFASKAHLQKFQSDPTAYLPKYGGYCAYAVAVNGKKVNVDPLTYEIRKGRLYLFYNKGKNNTLEFWLSESPNELVSKADENWEQIKN